MHAQYSTCRADRRQPRRRRKFIESLVSFMSHATVSGEAWLRDARAAAIGFMSASAPFTTATFPLFEAIRRYAGPRGGGHTPRLGRR